MDMRSRTPSSKDNIARVVDEEQKKEGTITFLGSAAHAASTGYRGCSLDANLFYRQACERDS